MDITWITGISQEEAAQDLEGPKRSITAGEAQPWGYTLGMSPFLS